MKKLTKQDGSSMDTVKENIDKLKELFPDVFTEGKVDFDALQAVLGDYVETGEERYSFNWHGKAQARRIAQTPSTGTLRPCPEESVDWETTQNLFIEGDNLEVLKLLQKSYHKKVKMIYIDPPYNTGKEFIYPDKFQENLDTYLKYTGQKDDEGHKFSTNTETTGRYHTNWLNMMYPRLKLAHNLLRDDGVIFISIDDNEVDNLRKMCNEIFGEENFVACLPWQKKVSPSNDSKFFSNDHEYIIVIAKEKKPEVISRLERTVEHNKYYKNPDNDPMGNWNSTAATCNKNSDERPNLYYSIKNPNTNEDIWPRKEAVWAFSKDSMNKLLQVGRIYWGADGKSKSPRIKNYLSEAKPVVPRSVLLYSDVGHTQAGTSEFRKLMLGVPFDYPKPTSLLMHLLRLCSTGQEKNDFISLDFFAGSATTAHAILNLNKEDGGNRKFIMVQLPEPCDKKSEAFKAGYKTIADIGKERIRRAAAKIKEELTTKDTKNTKEEVEPVRAFRDVRGSKMPDLGFKVFKLDSSNIKPWDADFDNLQRSLEDSVSNIKSERSAEDVLYEILLKYGLDLTLPIETRMIEGKKVFSIGLGALVICLDSNITLDVVEGIGKLKAELDPEVMRVVFKDNGFKDDVVKTNAIQILKRYDIEDVKSL